ncbi:Ger(x)C family spore germination protein [Heliorestis convoluta]|uniref:Germination, Ger(X)C family protein n=1 Tax=Heliorestis convoluta TaxID=356322 RepID=A0A5Q2N1V7_9FIRM|nr:Ger(x)C family spore germination protein [Heliorestis convoluta]QGG47823.1 germination, Ger(x)C family protein [Heliorestis convoluta]
MIKSIGNKKKLGTLLLLFLSPLWLTSCWDKKELDQMAFVLSMGIDQSPQGLIEVTARIAVPEAIVGGGGGGGDQSTSPAEISKVVTIAARTIPEGFALLEATVERRVTFTQCRTVVIGEELVRQGLDQILDFFNRHREFRRTLIFFMSKGSPAREIFQHAVPVLEENIARYIEDIVDIQRQFGFSPFVRLHDLNNEMEVYHLDGLIPIMAINPEVAKEKEGTEVKPRPTSEFRADEGSVEEEVRNIPSTLHRSGGNPVSYIGAGVLVGGHLVGYMDADEVRITEIIRGRYQTGIWTFPDPMEEGKYVSVILDQQKPVRIKVDESTDPIRIEISARLLGKLLEVQAGPYVTPEAFRFLEEAIAEELNQQALDLIQRMQALPADPFYLIRPLRWRTLTTKEYMALPWHEWYQKADIVVSIQPEIEFFGFQLAPARPNPATQKLLPPETTEEEDLSGEAEWE